MRDRSASEGGRAHRAVGAPAVEWAEGGREREWPRWIVVAGRRHAVTVVRTWLEGPPVAGGAQRRVFLVEAGSFGRARIAIEPDREVSIERIGGSARMPRKEPGHLW